MIEKISEAFSKWPLYAVIMLTIMIALAPPAHCCGIERVNIKNLNDKFDWEKATRISTSVEDLTWIDAYPKSALLKMQNRRFSEEMHIYEVEARLIGFKMEGDADYHIVIGDVDKPQITMITEIPSPECVKNPEYRERVKRLRAWFRAIFYDRKELTSKFISFKTPPKIYVYGLGFFDFKHGQTGVAQNAFELHPVLDMCAEIQQPEEAFYFCALGDVDQ